MVDLSQIRTAICGSPTLGVYTTPTSYTDTDHARGLVTALAKLKAEANIVTPLTGTTTAPVYRKPSTIKEDLVDQTGNRWRSSGDGRYRTLAEMWQQIATDIAALPDGAPVSTLPAGTSEGNLLWAADLSKNDVISAGYKDTDWNTETGPSWPPPIGTYAGRRAIKFQLGRNGKRIEVEPNHETFNSSFDRWFGFSFYLETDFPLNSSSWHVIWQLHGNDTVSPKMDLQAHKGGMTIADNGALTPLQKQHWYNCVVHAAGTGRMSVWLDDKLVIDNFNAGTSRPNYYLKVGSYQDTAIGAGTIYQADHKLGTGYGSVRT